MSLNFFMLSLFLFKQSLTNHDAARFLQVRARSGIGKNDLQGGLGPQGPTDPLEAQGASGRDAREEVIWDRSRLSRRLSHRPQ